MWPSGHEALLCAESSGNASPNKIVAGTHRVPLQHRFPFPLPVNLHLPVEGHSPWLRRGHAVWVGHPVDILGWPCLVEAQHSLRALAQPRCCNGQEQRHSASLVIQSQLRDRPSMLKEAFVTKQGSPEPRSLGGHLQHKSQPESRAGPGWQRQQC